MSKKSLIRISTAGSVDDGKSTLIGRLLHDSRAIMEDQWEQIRDRNQAIDLARLTDGLKSEREQGITIDVAYKYFSTPRRKFILADTPGHVQYTRNMATGASTADVAIILIDARNGITEQTRRHMAISVMLKIPSLIFAINKIDLVDFSQDRYWEIADEVEELLEKFRTRADSIIPISALNGDNITKLSSRMKWYEGPSLLERLESIDVSSALSDHGRLAVQYVIRPDQSFRGFAGKVAQGRLKVGDSVTIFPETGRNTIKAIYRGDVPIHTAHQGQSIVIELDHQSDVQSGSIISHESLDLHVSTYWQTQLVWFSESACQLAKPYILKHRSRYFKVSIEEVQSRLNLELLKEEVQETLDMNDIGIVTILSQSPIGADLYENSRLMGSFLLIEPRDFSTVAAGTFQKALSTVSIGPLTWHFIDTEDQQIMQKLSRESSALVIAERFYPESPRQDLWWLSEIAKNNHTLITNRPEFLDFQGVHWQSWQEGDFNRLLSASLSEGVGHAPRHVL